MHGHEPPHPVYSLNLVNDTLEPDRKKATDERDTTTARANAVEERPCKTVRQMKSGEMAAETVVELTGLTAAKIDRIREMPSRNA